MPPVYDATLKNLRMVATRDGVANGTLEITTAADAVLSVHGLDATAGTVTGAVWTPVFDAASVNASGTGTAAKARIKNSGGTIRVTGLTVGLDGSGSDVELINTNIVTGQPVELTAATITHAA